MKILVTGSGGREHAIGSKLEKSRKTDQVYFLPGNGGTAETGINLQGDSLDFDYVYWLIKENRIDLVVAGSEVHLSLGMADFLEERGVRVFGPVQQAAKIESSKVYAKELMKKHQIPTPVFFVVNDFQNGVNTLKGMQFPVVIKADGLAAGKGVLICNNQVEAEAGLKEIFVENRFGEAGRSALIEEFIAGPEISLLAFTDGYTVLPLVPARDYKRIGDGNTGKNTGGMGALADWNLITPETYQKIVSRILKPAVEAMKASGVRYQGILYAGVILKEGEPYALEFNCRFGDPETQAILPLLENDLTDLFTATIFGNLDRQKLVWKNGVSLTAAAVSRGYPERYEKGQVIRNLKSVSDMVSVYHAGTEKINEEFRVNGGRVLNIGAVAADVKSCRDVVYEALKVIEFDNMSYRKDIGL